MTILAHNSEQLLTNTTHPYQKANKYQKAINGQNWRKITYLFPFNLNKARKKNKESHFHFGCERSMELSPRDSIRVIPRIDFPTRHSYLYNNFYLWKVSNSCFLTFKLKQTLGGNPVAGCDVANSFAKHFNEKIKINLSKIKVDPNGVFNGKCLS